MRGRVWTALLQPRAADAHVAARGAAEHAYIAARMFLQDDRPDLAAWALEMGRGLIIHAATESRDAAAKLEARGEAELARAWREATAATPLHRVPSELRRRVVATLAGVELTPDGALTADFDAAVATLPDPPTADEIRAALIALDLDALVYLVPGEGGTGGLAAVIPAADHPHWLALPRLQAEQVRAFADTGAIGARDLRPQRAGRAAEAGVAAMCQWAWEAVVGPVLADVGGVDADKGSAESSQGSNSPADPNAPAGSGAPTEPDRRAESDRRAGPDRPPRIVLIPARESTRIPWHAAQRTVDGRVRHAVEDAVFSYAASARMFCASAWAGDIPIGDTGLVVSDPDTADEAPPLPGARAEAAAIRDSFYPGARLIGRAPDGAPAPDGPGTPAELRAWLRDPDGGAVLHLACHATVSAEPGREETSYLLLADGERLSAEALADSLAEPARPSLALAVLAACRSNESGRGHDEAFSLATALLLQGTRSVVSAQWSVPDTGAALLMFMFHHYLRTRNPRPADALRAAQLWMLRAGDLPDDAPPGIRAVMDAEAPSGVSVWGAFTHAGR